MAENSEKKRGIRIIPTDTPPGRWYWLKSKWRLAQIAVHSLDGTKVTTHQTGGEHISTDDLILPKQMPRAFGANIIPYLLNTPIRDVANGNTEKGKREAA